MRWLSLLFSSISIAAGSVAGTFAMPNPDAEAAYARGDYETAFKLWLPLAEQGSPQAQLAIGHMYERGEWVAQDKQAAMEWYSKAADQSSHDAAMAPISAGVAAPVSSTYTPLPGQPPDTSSAVIAPPVSRTVTPLPQPAAGPQPASYPPPAAPAAVPVARPVFVPVFYHHWHHR
jgi:hypothetical protein